MHFIKTIITFLEDKAYRELLYTTCIFLSIGTVMFHYLEGWSWVDSAYFSIVTLTTVGYGDFHPATSAGKIFTIFYIIIGVGLILNFINTIYNHYDITKKERKQDKK